MVLHLVRHARSMPAHVVVGKAVRMAGRAMRRLVLSRWYRRQCSYAAPPEGALRRLLPSLDPARLAPCREPLARLCPLYLDHRFDLLGSGWVRVAHGETFAGFAHHRYGPGPAPRKDWRAFVTEGHWPANRAAARALLEAIDDPGYRPIDWHVDFKSGYRWSQRLWGPTVPYGHGPGIDIKVPWELARLQHLPQLALLHLLDGDAALAREVRNQILDFLGANPPGWGVNWACAMDVAIRGANLVLARELLLAGGVGLDAAFEEALAAALLAHGRFIVANLEWTGEHRGNHYLADICGLAFIAAALPGAEAAGWLDFVARELPAEIVRQFHADGGNFEASTAYHRLSAEMALYAAALLSRQMPPEVFAVLARAVDFAAWTIKPSGRAVQIGDTDSGRFFKLVPSLDGTAERVLNFGGLLAAAKGLFDHLWPVPPEGMAETLVVAALAKRRWPPAAVPAAAVRVDAAPAVETSAKRVVRTVVRPRDSAVLEDLRVAAFPDFGLFIWRSERCFFSVRCGPIGQNGQGGHAHNDQLAVELEIDGEDWAADPGTFVYTSDLAARNLYRSALAHFVPRCGNTEPARMLAPFQLEDRAQARVLHIGPEGFLGMHRGFGFPLYRRVSIAGGAVVIEDFDGGMVVTRDTVLESHEIRSATELRRLASLDLPFSAGYGLR